jgi:hypothetical protein
VSTKNNPNQSKTDEQPVGHSKPVDAKTDAQENEDDKGTRAGGTVTNHQPDADIAALTGTLADEALDHPEGQSGTVERTPIVGQPEEVVEEPQANDGLEEDAPRFGPNHARAADEKASQKG